jgi:hypothetical protein
MPEIEASKVIDHLLKRLAQLEYEKALLQVQLEGMPYMDVPIEEDS